MNDSTNATEVCETIGTATYSPEDNKLRLYPDVYFDDVTLQRVKAAGFKWATNQGLFVAPMWTPAREDLLLELCGEINDEDISCLERSADRAERFGNYRDKRRSEATSHADDFEAGPQVFGHQSAARAERQARKHDRHRVKAVSQWSKAEYWQRRTEGVISHALHKAKPSVRRGRIDRLEKGQRKHEKTVELACNRIEAWRHVETFADCDERPTQWPAGNPYIVKSHGRGGSYSFLFEQATSASELACTLAAFGYSTQEYEHPRNPECVGSLYQLLSDEVDPITPREAARLFLGALTALPTDPEGSTQRWCRHYELRLTYERAMLANEGGAATDLDIIPGGWLGNRQIVKVHKSPATGKVTSVVVLVEDDRGNYAKMCNKPGPMPLVEKRIPLKRFGEDVYRAPTADELERFETARKASRAKAKASQPKLINPTEADAARLQQLWNERAKERHEQGSRHAQYDWQDLATMTQKQFSASRGDYGTCKTVSLRADGSVVKFLRHDASKNPDLAPVVCKIRISYATGGSFTAADRVVLLSDKPGTSLGLDWAALESPAEEKPAEPVAPEPVEPVAVPEPSPAASSAPAGCLF